MKRAIVVGVVGLGSVLAGVASASSSPPSSGAPSSSPVASSDAPSTATAASTGGDSGFLPAERVAALADTSHVVVGDYPVQPDGVPWPTSAWSYGPVPAGADVAAIEDVLRTAFPASAVGTGSGVDSVVVVHGGRIVVQRYKADWDPDAAHVSWSMAKSITHAMYGVAINEGWDIDLEGPAAVPEWQLPFDPRSAITVDELLMMRSGLEWNEEYAGVTDVTEMLYGTGADDRAAYAVAKPLEFEPDTVWEYSTGTSIILGRILGDHIGFGHEGVEWAQEHLFGPLGITSVHHALDATGAMSTSSAIDLSAQDFARFGLLYLRDGMWDGEQLLPAGWVDHARLPAPDALGYGHQWWLPNAENPVYADYPLTFQANGFAGQTITIVPELDLVVVVLASDTGPLPDATADGLVAAFAGVA